VINYNPSYFGKLWYTNKNVRGAHVDQPKIKFFVKLFLAPIVGAALSNFDMW